MADNYLERRMEDLRSGRISASNSARARAKKARAQATAKGDGEGLMHNPHIRTYYIPEIEGIDIERVRDLIRAGHIVYFGGGGEDPLRASRLARTIGARYVPSGMEPPAGAELMG